MIFKFYGFSQNCCVALDLVRMVNGLMRVERFYSCVALIKSNIDSRVDFEKVLSMRPNKPRPNYKYSG